MIGTMLPSALRRLDGLTWKKGTTTLHDVDYEFTAGDPRRCLDPVSS